MSKALKTLIICGYAYLLFQYLRISLKPVTVEIDINYIYRNLLSKKEQAMASKKFHNYSTYVSMYKKPKRLGTDLKYVLKYTTSLLHRSTPWYEDGQKPFLNANCTYYNCYVTTQRDLLNDYRDYDAILFDVENNWDGPILVREPYQRFIFMASESAARYPLCDDLYDNFYNLTWTYRLDSDIQSTYFNILDKKGNHVGPKMNMTWVHPMKPTPERVKQEIGGKTKAAAWFVSNCNAPSGRDNVTKQIKKGLKKYNMTVDVYGWCGKKRCPKERFSDCLDLLRSDYYFYLSFENTLCTDYVTEKILHPINNYAVPIVFGGADYSRFLPPGSYINAGELTPREVVSEMMKAIKNPAVYEDYFRWHNYYSFVKNHPEPDVCHLCRILNEDPKMHTWYTNIRKWWNPYFNKICARGGVGYPIKESKPVRIVKEFVEDMKR